MISFQTGLQKNFFDYNYTLDVEDKIRQVRSPLNIFF